MVMSHFYPLSMGQQQRVEQAFFLSPVSTVLRFDMGVSSIDTHISAVYCMGVNTLGAEGRQHEDHD